jgi:hypothetical protein
MRGLVKATYVALAVTAGTAMSARADWEISTYTNLMTDRTETAATLAATKGQAALRVACLKGRVFPEVTFSSHVGFLRIDTDHRFDDGPVISRTAPLSRDGRSLWLWSGETAAAVKKIAKAKRLRVQIFPLAAPAEFLEFNLAGSDKALEQVRCK